MIVSKKGQLSTFLNQGYLLYSRLRGISQLHRPNLMLSEVPGGDDLGLAGLPGLWNCTKIWIMKTQIVKVDVEAPGERELEAVIRVLKKGGVIVYPTDTFYGLGADSFSRKAAGRIYELKGRAWTKPLSVVISDRDMLEQVARDIPLVFGAVAQRFWPGPLTVVFYASDRLPEELHAGSGSIAVRLPDHPWLRRLVSRAGFPIIATSANPSGGPEVSDPGEAADLFLGRVECIVNGGPTPGGKPSTVLDLRGNPRILREGAVATPLLRDLLPLVQTE